MNEIIKKSYYFFKIKTMQSKKNKKTNFPFSYKKIPKNEKKNNKIIQKGKDLSSLPK